MAKSAHCTSRACVLGELFRRLGGIRRNCYASSRASDVIVHCFIATALVNTYLFHAVIVYL